MTITLFVAKFRGLPVAVKKITRSNFRDNSDLDLFKKEISIMRYLTLIFHCGIYLRSMQQNTTSWMCAVCWCLYRSSQQMYSFISSYYFINNVYLVLVTISLCIFDIGQWIYGWGNTPRTIRWPTIHDDHHSQAIYLLSSSKWSPLPAFRRPSDHPPWSNEVCALKIDSK